MSGPDKGKSFDLKDDTIYIGRSPDNDIKIDDRSVSRKHAKISRKGDNYFIVDLKSAYGTFIDGKKIESGIDFEIQEGLPFAIGMTTICLGEHFSDEIFTILDSIDLSKELNEDGSTSISDRPMTSQKNMEFMSKVSTILMQSSNINEILQKILHYIFDLLKRIDRSAFILVRTETGEISEVITESKKGSDDTGTMYSRDIVNRVIREGKSIMISDTHAEDEIDFSESLKLMKIRSVMCVPLISRSQIRGAIYIDSLDAPFGFRQDDLVLFTVLSTSAALAIENASLYSHLGKE